MTKRVIVAAVVALILISTVSPVVKALVLGIPALYFGRRWFLEHGFVPVPKGKR